MGNFYETSISGLLMTDKLQFDHGDSDNSGPFSINL